MSKKQILTIIIIAVFMFLFMNWNYFPGSNSSYFSTGQDIIEIGLFAITLLTLPVVLLFLLVNFNAVYNKEQKVIRTWVLIDLTLLILFLLQLKFFESAMENWSRSRTIHNAAPLIKYVEKYKEQHGSYPQMIDVSLYPTRAIAYKSYYYSGKGDQYSLKFLRQNFEVNFYSPNDSIVPDFEMHSASEKGWYYYYSYDD